jgi:uncharacterized membrane protein
MPDWVPVSTQSDLAETSRIETFSDGVFAIAITARGG